MSSWKAYQHSLYANSISQAVRFYDRLIQCEPLVQEHYGVFNKIECPRKEKIDRIVDLPDLKEHHGERAAVFFNGNLNYALDIEDSLKRLKEKLSRTSRVFILSFNPYYRALYILAGWLGLRSGEAPSCFVTRSDLEDICKLSGYELIRITPCGYFPLWLFGIGSLINSVCKCIPFLRWAALANVIVLRPIIQEKKKPSLCVVIPARNERGNIAPAVERLAYLNDIPLEIIFVEGHSSDNTWEEIQRVTSQYSGPFKIHAYRQTGKGKVDAVRLGFSKAESELLTILDADLTMPPEMLHRFYDAYCAGLADFVNGSRLVYPQEDEAMRFLNLLGNIFFAKALSWTLDQRLSDSLCGTKLVSRRDYQRMIAWRDYFGDIDPFGDFELLFPAATLALGIVNIPIRYLSRTYGSTNIHRFRHGLILLRMTLIGLFRIKLRA